MQLKKKSIILIILIIILSPFIWKFLVFCFSLLYICLLSLLSSLTYSFEDYLSNFQQWKSATISCGPNYKIVSESQGNHNRFLTFHVAVKKGEVYAPLLDIDSSLDTSLANFAFINQKEYEKQTQEMLDKLEKTDHLNLYITKNDHYSYSQDYNQSYQGADGIRAVYIHPDKMSKQDFNLVVNCLKDAKDGKATPIDDKQPKNIRDYFNLNRVLVYAKPIIPKDTNLFEDYHLNRTFLFELKCQNPKYSLFIKPNGVVKIGNREFKKETPVNLGYFDKNGKFVRETKIENSIVIDADGGKAITQSDRDKADSGEDQFPIELRVNRSLKLVFNSKGEPINDYLKTCKNSEGKTIFNIFTPKAK